MIRYTFILFLKTINGSFLFFLWHINCSTFRRHVIFIEPFFPHFIFFLFNNYLLKPVHNIFLNIHVKFFKIYAILLKIYAIPLKIYIILIFLMINVILIKIYVILHRIYIILLNII